MKALVLGGILLVAGFAVAFALPRNEVSGLLDLAGERLPAPPELKLLTPADGEGVGPRVTLAGQALSTGQDVIDVQYRVDDGRWTSIEDILRGQRSVPFSLTLELSPGDHVLEARAWDGDAYSLAARALVRRDAPTIRILSPTEGEGVPAGVVEVSGVVQGSAERVLVESGGEVVEANLTAARTWTARLPLGSGVHLIRATALAPVPSLPARVLVAAGDPAPGTLAILTPREGAAYGEAGDLACGGGCILFTGTSRGASAVHATIDGVELGPATLLPTGAWSHRVPIARLASGPHVASFAAPGGAPQVVTFLARTPLALEIAGNDVPRPTWTPLSFEASGEGAAHAEWSLDGVPVGGGPSAQLMIDRPGDHTLRVVAPLPNGGSATATRALHALNRPPDVTLGSPLLVGADIRLEANASDEDGRIASYRWEFGDGTTLTTPARGVLHRYLARGIYTANVTAIDDHGATATAATIVVVPNVAPLANFTWDPQTPTILDVVTLRDTSIDLDGVLGTRAWALPGNNASDAATPALRLPGRGPHPITLTVVDDAGAEATLTQIVHVADIAPEASFSWTPRIPRAHEEVFFVDNSTDVDGPIVRREWAFGANATALGAGAVHTFAAPGLYNVTLRVVDDMGLAAEITLPIRVADGEPTIRAVVAEPPKPRAQDEVRFRALADDREGSLVALHWDFGDGTNSTEREPHHRYARSGLYNGNITVYDEAGLSVTFPFLLEVVNAPPTGTLALVDGGYAAFPSTLVANATDPDGQVALYRFDADGDGRADCETTAPTCTFTYDAPGAHLLRVWIEDDEAAIHEAQAIVDILAPPSHLAPPRVTIESPTPHATLRGDHLLRGDVRGIRPIAKVELQFRNGDWAYSGSKDAWRLATGGPAWTSLVDTRGLADGDYELVVRATDTEGGQGHARIPVRVLNGARPSEVSLQLLDPPTELDDDAYLRGSAFHPQGVTSVRYRIDDANWRYVSESPLAFTIHLDRDALAPGSHILQLGAYRGPTEKATLDHLFRVGGSAPALVIDEPQTPTAYGLLHAAGRIVGPGHAQWRLDHGLWRDLHGNGTWNLSEETTRIPGGQHTLELRAVSPDLRHNSTPRSFTVQIVNPPFPRDDDRAAEAPTAPSVRIDVPAPTAGAILAAVALAAALARRNRLG